MVDIVSRNGVYTVRKWSWAYLCYQYMHRYTYIPPGWHMSFPVEEYAFKSAEEAENYYWAVAVRHDNKKIKVVRRVKHT